MMIHVLVTFLEISSPVLAHPPHLAASSQKHTEESSVELLIPAPLNAMGPLAGAEYATGFLDEVLVLADRNVKNIFRTPVLFLSRIGLNVSRTRNPSHARYHTSMPQRINTGPPSCVASRREAPH